MTTSIRAPTTLPQDVVENVLRALNDNSYSRSNRRRRALQQRNFGFPFCEMESLEVVRQNLATIEQLSNSKSDKMPEYVLGYFGFLYL